MSTHQQSNKPKQDDSTTQKQQSTSQELLNQRQILQPSLLRQAIENPHAARPKTILQLQRIYGNRVVSQIIAAASKQTAENLFDSETGSPRGEKAVGQAVIAREPTPLVQQKTNSSQLIQASMLPLEEPQPGREEKVLNSYIHVLKYKAYRQEWKNGDERMVLLKQMEEEVKASNWERAWGVLKELKVKVDIGEARDNIGSGGPQPLNPEQIEKIEATLKKDVDTAHKVLINLAQNEEVQRAVFGEDKFDKIAAGINFLGIAVQLLLYQTHGGFKVDADGSAKAAGHKAHNVNRGGGKDAKIILTIDWANSPEPERIATLIHEASHGSKVANTADLAYIKNWAGDALTGKVALKNADSFAKAALLQQGDEQGMKKLEGGEGHTARIRKILGWVDFRLTQARSKASRLNEQMISAKSLPVQNQVFNMVEENHKEMYELSKALQLPWQEGRDPNSRNLRDKRRNYEISNADLEMMLMFINNFSLAIGHLNLINSLKIVESENPGVGFDTRSKMWITSGAISKMKNEDIGLYLIAQIVTRFQIPDHWKSAFHTLTKTLSTKRIDEEGEQFKQLEQNLN